MARIYLAAAWSRKEEMQDIANRLESMGHEITSRWLINEKDSSTTVSTNVKMSEIESNDRELRHQINALHDCQDVLSADYIIRFSDADEMAFPLVASKLCSGARHFEMGLMYAMELMAEFADDHPECNLQAPHRLLFVVGGKQNIFDRLPEVMHVKDTEEMINIMYRAAELEGIVARYDGYWFVSEGEEYGL